LLTQVAIKFMITREFADERTIMEKANMTIHDVPEPLWYAYTLTVFVFFFSFNISVMIIVMMCVAAVRSCT
jgi:hypothetical protein